MRVLLCEADAPRSSALYRALNKCNFVVDIAVDDEAAWELLHSFVYDLVLLDVLLPELDGIQLCHRLRELGNPVLILLMLNSSNADDRIRGLKSGADGYLIKPFQEEELLAHIQTLSRRGLRRASAVLSWGPLLLNPTSRQVTCQGQILKINRKEYQLLELFLSHPRQMFSREKIGDRLWNLDEQIPSDATIKTHIRNIRCKLEQLSVQDFIQTHYGQGYCLNPAYESVPPPSRQIASPVELTIDTVTANLWQELMETNARLHQEIEQRQQIETQLRRSEMMLRNAQRVAQIGCWEFDISTQETYWTDELYFIHGLEPNRPAPNHEENLKRIHPDDLQIHEKHILIPATKGEAFEANFRIIRADGEIRYVNARGGPIFDQSGNMIKIAGTTFDVTRWVVNGAFLKDTSSTNTL